ncbi:MAG: ACT domain-containing protein [Phycisphaerae bacterium]|nr:ACT domain-containing protein [Phycisphaerae bacterium]
MNDAREVSSSLPALELEWLDDVLALVRLSASAVFPHWIGSAGFVSVTRSEREMSIVAPIKCVPDGQSYVGPFRAARVRGELPHHVVGVLVRLAEPLALAQIPILAISTFDTDYVLVRAEHLKTATRAWRDAGFVVH